jgi:lipopolysaccharide transport system ATP-binding protein
VNAIITVENLGKKYRISHQGERQRYVALRDVLTHKVTGWFRNGKSENGNRKPVEDFWALKDVSFEIKQGEVVGIIGRNGAGKSTLLKILSRITEPTEGRVTLNGRVASLLEVGTGFHPELTGRENIFLNGAILGMNRVEIKKKFDEIVAFAEVQKFLDTPVKRYSSGMYVRLAFAVAAHLEPEILVVDEVLAVGDAEFQKKCLGKMESISRSEGRTVLFVSHNMKAIQTLCQTGIVLEDGRLKCLSTAQEALRVYSESSEMQNTAIFPVDRSRPSINVVSVDSSELDKGNLIVDIDFKSPFPLSPPVGGLVISSSLGTPVFGSNPRFHNDGFGHPKLSEGVLRMTVTNLPVHAGTYKLSVWLGDWHTDYDEKRDALAFEFKRGHPAGNTPNPEVIGFTDATASWSVLKNGTASHER